MTTATKPKSGYEKWQDGVNKAVGNARWDVYDCEIKMAVNEFNRHLTGTAGYLPLNWQLIKAMMWTETGAGHEKWQSNPMQIGVLSDPGLGDLLASNKGGEIILPAATRSSLNPANATTIPRYNIRAGIGYLLMKIANFAIKNIPDMDTKIYDITVKAGDSLDKIARVRGSTIEMMKKLNPTAHVLRPGQVLKYQKATMKKVIVGWKPNTTQHQASPLTTTAAATPYMERNWITHFLWCAKGRRLYAHSKKPCDLRLVWSYSSERGGFRGRQAVYWGV